MLVWGIDSNKSTLLRLDLILFLYNVMKIRSEASDLESERTLISRKPTTSRPARLRDMTHPNHRPLIAFRLAP